MQKREKDSIPPVIGSVQEPEKAPASRDEPEETEEATVRFTEPPGIRLISAEDWAKAGVPDHADTRWDQHNGWCVLKADLGLNEEQFARIILADRGFRVHLVPKKPSE
jgi:hypothetical protein